MFISQNYDEFRVKTQDSESSVFFKTALISAHCTHVGTS